MKNINKDILKQLENDNFSKEIIEDPLRLAYYTALKGYKEYLSTANIEGTPLCTTKFKKYNKDLLNIINTDLHVVHLLLTDLELSKKLSCSFYSPIAGDVPNWHLRLEKPVFSGKDISGKDTYRIGSVLSKGERNVLIFDFISTLFPILVFAKYKTTNLKKVITLLSMKIGANITDICYGNIINREEFVKYGFNEKSITSKTS